MPSRTRKKPSAVRSPVRNSRSRSSTSLVSSARRERVGARDEDRRHAEHVGASRAAFERAHELRRRDEHLAAEVAALLLRRELVLEVHAGGAGLDHRLHQLVRVQRAAEAGLGVGDDRREPVRAVPRPPPSRSGRRAAARCSAAARAPARCSPGRGSGRGTSAAEVRVGGDLPAGEVDRLEPGLHHLHRLAAGQRAERGDVGSSRRSSSQSRSAPSRASVCSPGRPSRAGGRRRPRVYGRSMPCQRASSRQRASSWSASAWIRACGSSCSASPGSLMAA